MAPEMAAVYIIGWIPTALVSATQYYVHQKKMRSPEMQQLQSNLKKIDLYWSESQANFIPRLDGTAEKGNYRRTLLILGVIFIALSWFGFLFNLLVFISTQYLAVSRREKLVFASALSHNNLSTEQVQILVNELAQS